MKKPKFLIFLLFLSVFSLISNKCEEDDGNENVSCDIPFAGESIFIDQIDGQNLPFYTVNIDNDNFSKVNSGTFLLFNDGTWVSSLVNEQENNGNNSLQTISRTGTWTRLDDCNSLALGRLKLINDQNAALGTLYYEVFNYQPLTYAIRIEGSVEYSFEYWIE